MLYVKFETPILQVQMETTQEQMNREKYLNLLAIELNKRLFKQHGYELNLDKIRFSCGFPSKGAMATKNKRIGECWNSSVNGFSEIFIHPELETIEKVGGVLVHELIHAKLDGQNVEHKKPFRDIAVKVGLEGKMTATNPNEELKKLLLEIEKDLGKYPHKELIYINQKKQGTRMLKLVCPELHSELKKGQYILRGSLTTIQDLGLPSCPCGEKMEIEHLT